MNQRSQVLSHIQKQGERNLTRSQKTALVKAEKYIEDNKIEELMNELLAQVIHHRPENIEKFLKQQLEAQISSKGENLYYSKQDFEAIFMNYDFFNESKVPYNMLVQALGLVGVNMTTAQFLKKYPQYEAQKYIVKEQFITILSTEYRDRLKKQTKKKQDGFSLQAIAADSFVNDLLIFYDMAKVEGSVREGYGCMKRILDYMLQNPELCDVGQFKLALSPDLTADKLAIILNGIAVEMLDRGYYQQSELFLDASIAENQRIYGEHSIQVAKAYNNYGLLQRQLEHYDDAMINLKKSLKIYQDLQGKNCLAGAEVQENIAVLLRTQEKYQQAQEYYDQILAIKLSAFGPNDIQTAQTVENVAVILLKQEKFDAALEKLYSVLEIKRKTEGETSLSYAGTLHNISIALEGKKEMKKALKISKEALQISQNDSLTSSFLRTMKTHVKKLEDTMGSNALDVSQELK